MDFLNIERTKLANQRTYLAYIRTGFSLASLAGIFKRYYLFAFGLIMIVTSTIQYYIAIRNLNNHQQIKMYVLDYTPLIYFLLSLFVLYLEFLNMS